MLSAVIVAASSFAAASTLDWSGGYRIEGVSINSTTLASPANGKSYLLQHMHLSPKIVVQDGVEIVSRFELLNNTQYPNSQAGQLLGSTVDNNFPNSGYAENSSTMSENQGQSSVQISQAYLHLQQEYGSLIVGRAPIHFGLGIAHNSGMGAFDHWLGVEDQVTYRIHIGNATLTPMIGRPYQASPGQGASITDQAISLEYTSSDSSATAGVFYENRASGQVANDTPTALAAKFTPASILGGFSNKTVNVYFAKDWGTVDFKIEAGFLQGNTGLFNSLGQEVHLSGYGIATELSIPNQDSKWYYKLRTGIASGDDPNSGDYEGYTFNRNYDVAFLMFNHRLGQADFFKTNPFKSSLSSSQSLADTLDDEYISNAFYLSPQFIYRYSDKTELKNTLTAATILVDPISGAGTDKNVGFEYDFDVVYKPSDRIQWITTVGVILPGAMWKGGSSGYGNDLDYGLSTKAAINF